MIAISLKHRGECRSLSLYTPEQSKRALGARLVVGNGLAISLCQRNSAVMALNIGRSLARATPQSTNKPGAVVRILAPVTK
jgi:hypothetical protein